MVSLSALVDRCGFVLPSRNGPHSGCPLLVHPLGSPASASRSLKPIGVFGHPSACAIGRGMAIVSGVRMNDLGFVGAIGGWPFDARASLRTPPHALATGVQMTGLGRSVSLDCQPAGNHCSPAPDDTFSTRT